MAEQEKPTGEGRAEPSPPTPVSFSDEQLPDEASLLEDARTEEAVDDIVAHESDLVLQAEDAAAAAADRAPRRRGFWGGIGHLFALWLGTPTGRWLTFVLVVAGAAAIAALPSVRYAVLNRAGAQAGASVVVVDGLTQLPLQGITVTVAGHTKQTDAAGTARLAKLPLGAARLTIAEPGFATVQRSVTVGWGSNPLGNFNLTATGARYTIAVHDFLSDEPLTGVLATAGDATALSDSKGVITLTLERKAREGLQVTLSKDGYRSAAVSLKAAGQTTPASLLTARKAVYVSKASGRYDLYTSDADGTNRALLLAGTGNENGNISVVTSVDGTHAALVSTRDNVHDADGFLLNTLTLVDVGEHTATSIAHADQIQLLDWVGSRLIFEQVSSDPKIPVTSRYSLISYDYLTNSRLQLATAPKLNAVFAAQGALYYAVAATEFNGSLQPGLYKINPDGTNRQQVFETEVWSGLRSDYQSLALQTADGWRSFSLKNGAASAIDGPGSFTSRLYQDNADHTRSLWVNQGVLTEYDVAANKDMLVVSQGGLAYPVQWLGGGAVVYRVVTAGETADYSIGRPGGTPHKIADVANTFGFSSGQ